MNPIGSIQQPVIQTQTTPALGQARAPAAPTPTLPKAAEPEPVINAQAAEQRRYETIQRLSQDIANIYVVGDKRFTIFKDISGQYVTRFTSLRDGKVTYIPEPEIFKLQNVSQNTLPTFIKLNV